MSTKHKNSATNVNKKEHSKQNIRSNLCSNSAIPVIAIIVSSELCSCNADGVTIDSLQLGGRKISPKTEIAQRLSRTLQGIAQVP